MQALTCFLGDIWNSCARRNSVPFAKTQSGTAPSRTRGGLAVIRCGRVWLRFDRMRHPPVETHRRRMAYPIVGPPRRFSRNAGLRSRSIQWSVFDPQVADPLLGHSCLDRRPVTSTEIDAIHTFNAAFTSLPKNIADITTIRNTTGMPTSIIVIGFLAVTSFRTQSLASPYSSRKCALYSR